MSNPKHYKLTDEEIAFIRLILRTDDIGDGWRKVSGQLWRFVEGFSRQELIEWIKDEVGGRVRLNPDGVVVARYV